MRCKVSINLNKQSNVEIKSLGRLVEQSKSSRPSRVALIWNIVLLCTAEKQALSRRDVPPKKEVQKFSTSGMRAIHQRVPFAETFL